VKDRNGAQQIDAGQPGTVFATGRDTLHGEATWS
jgi:hypothetical protein